jgi:DNA primase large subunit
LLTQKIDFAKYPFMKESANYIKSLDLDIIKDLSRPDHVQIINRAEQKIKEAIINGVIKWKNPNSYDIEVLSYPTTILLLSLVNNNFLNKRYALAESKKAYHLLVEEEEEKIIDIAKNTFNWKIASIIILNQVQYFIVTFIDYLRFAPRFHNERWKLVNRMLIDGKVYLKKDEFVRLLEEEIRFNIVKVIDNSPRIDPPSQFTERINRINQLLFKRKGSFKKEKMPFNIVEDAFPPCITALNSLIKSGQAESHLSRFTLTSFLLNIGMSIENVIMLYSSMTDFNEKLTRYQVEHISGKRGSSRKYTPPNCNTLKTHGICLGKDILCKKVKHPLTYYLRKIRMKNNERRD